MKRRFSEKFKARENEPVFSISNRNFRHVFHHRFGRSCHGNEKRDKGNRKRYNGAGGKMKKQNRLNRRTFLKSSALGMVGTGMAAKTGWSQEKQEEEKKPLGKIKEYRTLGRTGFEASDLATGSIMDEGLLAAALDAGFNYIDTAEQYPGHHKIVGNAIKGHDRKKLFICSKIQILKDTSKEGFLKRTRKALEEIGTDYLDCMMIHFPETIESLKTPGFHEAMQELKTEGRVRFVGASHHGSFWFQAPETSMKDILLAAADDGRFDVFLMAYNFLQVDQGKKVLEVCNEKKIGIALMKTKPISTLARIKASVERAEEAGKEASPIYKEGLQRYQAMVAKGEDFLKKYNLQNPEEIKAAAVKFCLDNPHVHTVCCSARTYDELEQYLALSGQKLTETDEAILAAYEKGCGQLYCRHACGLCEPYCPHSVPVNTIMRYNHYFEAQGREKEAMLLYAQIPGAKADVCGQCQGYCEFACPYGVPIHGKLLLAHQTLTLA
jgi:predicted aldo/keto reductase-like oxidoreductase